MEQRTISQRKITSKKPQLYKDNKCPFCNQIETTTHPFTCSQQPFKIKNLIIKIYNQEISTRYNYKLPPNFFNELTKTIQLWTSTTLNAIISGIIYKNIVKIIQKYVNQDKINDCIYNSQNRLYQHLRQTWNERCKKFIKWEKTQKIFKKDKKKTKYKSTIKTPYDPTSEN
jgi:hypothetical protein